MTQMRMDIWKVGGRFVPETLMPILEDLDEAYSRVRFDKSFGVRLIYYYKNMWGDHLVYILLENYPGAVNCQIYLKERGF